MGQSSRERLLSLPTWHLGIDCMILLITDWLSGCVPGQRGDKKQQALGGHGAFSPGLGAEWRSTCRAPNTRWPLREVGREMQSAYHRCVLRSFTDCWLYTYFVVVQPMMGQSLLPGVYLLHCAENLYNTCWCFKAGIIISYFYVSLKSKPGNFFFFFTKRHTMRLVISLIFLQIHQESFQKNYEKSIFLSS